jgi:hypothetical protein
MTHSIFKVIIINDKTNSIIKTIIYAKTIFEARELA